MEGKDRIDQALSLDILTDEHANIRGALAWLAESGQGRTLLELVLNLEHYWHLGPYEAEGLAWSRRALALAPDVTEVERLDLLLSMAWLAHVVGDPESDTILASTVALAARAGTIQQRSDAAYLEGIYAEDRGAFHEAEPSFAVALDLDQQAGADWAVPICMYHLGIAAFGNGDLVLARHRLDTACEMGVARANPLVGPWALTYLVMIACEQDDAVTATALLRQHPAPGHVTYQHHRQVLWVAAGALASVRGQHAAAVRLNTAAAQLPGLFEPEARVVRRGLDLAREALGEAAFAAAREQGLRLSSPQAQDEIARLLEPVVEPDPAGVGTAVGATLSPREREVLVLLAQGQTNKEIADALFISHRTATSHVGNILAKLDLNTRTAAVAWAIRHGLA
jgi:DNA-binding CsgD family transcriptional regulator